MKIKNEKSGKIEDVRLPKKFKEKWIKALRSGKYKQDTGQLQTSMGYCCLGVGCRILHPKMKLNSLIVLKENTKIKIPNMLKGAGNKQHPQYNPIVRKLTAMNDSNNRSFNYIAAWIERNL